MDPFDEVINATKHWGTEIKDSMALYVLEQFEKECRNKHMDTEADVFKYAIDAINERTELRKNNTSYSGT